MSREFLTALAGVVRLAHCDALSEFAVAVRSGRLSAPAARDLFPYERRAKVETGLLSLPGEFPGVEVETCFNSSRNAHEIVTFGPGLMTQSFVRNPARIPRPARFREDYARRATGNFTGQMTFEEASGSFCITPCPTVVDVAGFFYGILIYSSVLGQTFSIGYIGIGFPDPNYRRFLTRMDLTNLLAESSVRSPSEEVQDLLNLEFLTQFDEAYKLEDGTQIGR